jgi:tRNA (adenine22-N1)-methyltransferase
MVKLPERLLCIAGYVPRPCIAADIGTDHALLPVYLVQQKICSRIIATDLQEGPLAAARATVALFNLWKQVEIRQGDGLEVIRPGEVSVIIIAGMGGFKISEILGRSGDVLRQTGRLILQPQAGASLVRRWLLGNGWELADEDLVLEDEHYYEIIVAERLGAVARRKAVPGTPSLDEVGSLLLEVGPRLIEKRHRLLAPYLERQIRDMESVLVALRRAQTPAAVQRKREWAGRIAFFKKTVNRLKRQKG